MCKLGLLLVAIVGFANLAAAQSLADGLVACAQPCVTQFTTGEDRIAGCQQFNIRCICSNEDFLDEIACCLADRCNPEEQEEAVEYAKTLCRGSGVTDLPDEVVCRPKNNSSSTARPQETETESGNAGAAPTMAAAGVIGGLMAAAAFL